MARTKKSADTLPPLTFPLEVSGKSFELRTVLSAEASTFLKRNEAVIMRYQGFTPASDEDWTEMAIAFLELFWKDEETSNKSARMILRGDHAGIDWRYDVEMTVLIRLAAQWILAMAGQVTK